MPTLFGSASTPAHEGSDNTASVTVTPPASMVAGQLVVVQQHTKRGASVPAVASIGVTGGQTWVDEGVNTVSSNRMIQVWSCIFNGTWSANPRFDITNVQNSHTAAMAVFDPSSGYGWVGSGADSGTQNGPAPTTPFDFTLTGITTTGPNRIVITFAMTVDDNELTVQTGGWNHIIRVDNLGGTDSAMAMAWKDMPTAGGTGDVVWRQTVSTGEQWIGRLMSFHEEAAGTLYEKTFAGALTPAGLLVKQDSKIIVGASTPAGVLLKRDSKILVGAMTPAGALSKQDRKTLAGALTPAGVLTKQDQKTLSGSITPAGTMSKIRLVLKTLAGAMTPGGVLTKHTSRTLSGGITPTGVLVKLKVVLKTMAGAITPAGSLTKQTNKPVAGSMTPAGTLTKRISKTFTGLVFHNEAADTFTRADSPSLGTTERGGYTWVDYGTGFYEIKTGRIRLAVDSTGVGRIAGFDIGYTDHQAQADVALTSSQAHVVARATTGTEAGSFLIAGFQSGSTTLSLYKRTGGSYVEVATYSAGVHGGHVRLNVRGDDVRVYLDGVLRISYTITDAALRTGTIVGVYGSNLDGQSDNFEAGRASHGIMTKQAQKTLAGSVTPTGLLVRSTIKTFTGGLTPVGVLTKRTAKSFAGAMTPTGVLIYIKVVLKSFAGSVTPAGTLFKQARITTEGSLTPAGSLLKQTNKNLSGSLTPAGVMTKLKAVLKIFTGAITPSGVLTKRTSRTLSGSMTPAGTLLRQINRTLSGGITPAGTMTKLKVVLKTMSGALTPAGTLVKHTARTLSAGITPSGTLVRASLRLRTFSGAITPTGSLTKRTLKTLAGSMTPTGFLSRTFSKVFAGTVAPVGQMTRTLGKFFSGTITPIGVMLREVIVPDLALGQIYWAIRRSNIFHAVKETARAIVDRFNVLHGVDEGVYTSSQDAFSGGFDGGFE